MIDWFPTAATADPGRDLGRWHGAIAMRRVARAIDALDPSTRGHSERVAALAFRMALRMGWSERRAQRLREAAAIHDVGKVSIPRGILQTPGPLTPGEYEIVKAHAAIGGRIVTNVLSRRQGLWVRHHHERWDGRGYPDRLTGTQIPDGAALIGLADAFDAMTSRSWCRPPLTEEQAVAECRVEAGGQFAPEVVDALLEVLADGELVPADLAAHRRAPHLRLITAA